MLSTDKFRLADWRGFGHDFMHQAIAPRHHGAGRRGTLVNNHVFNGLTAAQRQALIHNRLERQLFTTPQLVVGGNHSHSPGILNALLKALGREPTKHHRVRRTNAGAGLHGYNAFYCHRHVNDDAIALFDAHGFERTRKPTDLGVEFFVSYRRYLAVVAFKNDGIFAFGRRAQMAIKAVVTGI